MGHNDLFHRRSKHNRIANDEEQKLKELIARFSPTAIYSETLTMTEIPTDFPLNTFTNIFATSTPPAAATSAPTQAPTTAANSPTTAAPANTPATTDAATSITTGNTPTDTAANANANTAVTNAVGPDTSVAAPNTNTLTRTSNSLPSSAVSSRTLSLPTSASITSSAPSGTSTGTSGSATNVGGIVGGIAGALIGLAVLSFAIRLVMKRRNKLEVTPFDAHDFRRSAVMLNNEGPHSGNDPDGGYPEMMQHRNIGAASPAPTFGTLYGRPGPGQNLAAINTSMANDHYGGMGGAPHPYSAPYGQYSPPETAHSAHPMYPNAAHNPNAGPYGQNPFSPAPSSYTGSTPATPSTLAPGAGAGIAGAFGVAGAVAGAGMLTRQNSSATHLSNPHANAAPNPHMSNGYLGDGGYVDLDRSSVTPFQQAQYAEISERLGAPMPNGLNTPAVAAIIAKDHQEYSDHTQGPFADPTSGSRSGSPVAPPAPANIPPSLAPGVNGVRGSGISAETTMSDPRPSTDSQDITHDFPAPPSPSLHSPSLHSPSLHSPGFPSPGFKAAARVDSTPPSLPEIFIASGTASGVSTPQRVVSYDFPMSVGHSDIGHSSEGHGATLNSNLGTPVGPSYPSSIFGAYGASQGYPSGISAATQAAPGMVQDVRASLNGFKFPATPSPLASSFGVITPEAGKSRGFADHQDRPPVPATPTASQLSHEIKPDHEEEVVPNKAPAATPASETKRPHTVYDEDDAYGGI